METVAKSSILFNWNHEHESINPTPRDTNKNHNDASYESTIGMSEHYNQYSFEISRFDYEISRSILIFYDKVLELYFTQFIEMKSSLLLNISMIFMCFDGLLLVLSGMNNLIMELLESSIVGAILLSFMFVLLWLSTYNQNGMLNDDAILDKPIENELELKNGTNSTNDINNTKILTLTLGNNENNISNKKKKNGEVSEPDNIGKCELFAKHIRSFCVVVLIIILQSSIGGNLACVRSIIYNINN